LGQFGVQLQGGGQIAQGPDRDQGDFARVLSRHLHHEPGGVAWVDPPVARLAMWQIAQAICAMNEVGRGFGGFDHRPVCALRHRNASSGQCTKV
jgi:hypothetical protein